MTPLEYAVRALIGDLEAGSLGVTPGASDTDDAIALWVLTHADTIAFLVLDAASHYKKTQEQAHDNDD